ncbi:hypothetical protein FB462_3300 [Curtobacterium citreum]|nr:hypothetical protein FB462_3300 [Curtobacterium citreum]
MTSAPPSFGSFSPRARRRLSLRRVAVVTPHVMPIAATNAMPTDTTEIHMFVPPVIG